MNLSRLESKLKALESRKPAFKRIVWMDPGDKPTDEPGVLHIRWGRCTDPPTNFREAGAATEPPPPDELAARLNSPAPRDIGQYRRNRPKPINT